METVDLITGGAGFIGCELIKDRSWQNRRVIAVDSLLEQVHPNGAKPAAFSDSAELVVADVRNGPFWKEFFSKYKPGNLIHFAAETGTGQSLTESARHASVNVTGTAEMLDALTAAGHKPDHILLASSRAVYGEGAWRASDGSVFYPNRRDHQQLANSQWSFKDAHGKDAKPIPHCAQQMHPSPSSVYGATKLAQEHIISAWASAKDVPVSILRFQNVYGPGQSPFNSYTGIITLFHRQARAGKVIDVYEDGEIGRDFVYVTDVIAACSAALIKPPKAVRTLDVGFGKATTILEAARVIAASHGAPEPHISGKFRDGDVRWAVSDPAPLLNDLNVHAKVDFAEGSKRVSNWLIDEGYI
ncbi:NAD-dependent epimerase/dehydratase family protein [Methylobacterium nonmethylotrophicum]|uniref:NAD-dependent epimerase/dehydratase family protein n=1 Tax=Methylobacterium nonmethylotrophicum TaxID=1141884 RepID=A0A4Z0NR05_9HYPH|nr:NAD-dependent epimerase/dehydratase family protein [Methylobacterium nonmethylotrophicum]TGD99473.1 NAD-dependent epimerase/dehydratase family protein [Methylobacterium nonmethylotrophicum]